MRVVSRFRLSTLFWTILVVAAYFGGRASMFVTFQKSELLAADRALLAQRQLAKVQSEVLQAKMHVYRLQAAIDAGTAVPIRRVAGVLDDSTLLLRPLFTDEESRVRLFGVVLPEVGHHNKFITEFCFNKDACVTEKGRDNQGRFMVDVSIDGKSLSAELLRAGLARHDKVNSQDKEFADLESAARDAGLGLWVEYDSDLPN